LGFAAMNRRDFLRLTARGRERILEMSCERLYMRWVDARSGLAETGVTDEEGDAEVWGSEPPLDVTAPTPGQLFAELERRLAGVQVLRVSGREWLAGADFRREVESRIEAFRRRGGRVE
jgi:hypothetical protein